MWSQYLFLKFGTHLDESMGKKCAKFQKHCISNFGFMDSGQCPAVKPRRVPHPYSKFLKFCTSVSIITKNILAKNRNLNIIGCRVIVSGQCPAIEPS